MDAYRLFYLSVTSYSCMLHQSMHFDHFCLALKLAFCCAFYISVLFKPGTELVRFYQEFDFHYRLCQLGNVCKCIVSRNVKAFHKLFHNSCVHV